MKKLIAVVAGAVVCGAAAWANVELDVGYYGALSDSFGIKTSDNSEWKRELGDYDDTTLSGTVTYAAPVGLKVSAGIFFAHPWIMDVGLDLGLSLHMVTSLNYAPLVNGTAYDMSGMLGDGLTTVGGGVLGRVGGAFRFNLAEKHSAYVAPALVIGYDYIAQFDADLYTTRLFSFGLDVDLGYRFWVSDRFGIHAGVDLNVPLAGKLKLDGYENGDKEKILHTPVGGGFGIALYAGVSFNLGQ